MNKRRSARKAKTSLEITIKLGRRENQYWACTNYTGSFNSMKRKLMKAKKIVQINNQIIDRRI